MSQKFKTCNNIRALIFTISNAVYVHTQAFSINLKIGQENGCPADQGIFLGPSSHSFTRQPWATPGNRFCQQDNVKHSTSMTVVLTAIHTAFHTAPQVTVRCGSKRFILVKYKRRPALKALCPTGNNMSCKNLQS